MHKDEKERVVAGLTARLRSSDALIVADYRGLTMPQIDALRGRLLEHGARFSVVKNTLTRRAAREAGIEALLAMLEGPSAIAFVESDSTLVDVARTLADSARETRVLAIRGGLMQGRTISAVDVDELSKLPPFDVLRAQVLGAITSPLINLLALLNAPLQNLVGLIDARIEQLGGLGSVPAAPTQQPMEAEGPPAIESAVEEEGEPALAPEPSGSPEEDPAAEVGDDGRAEPGADAEATAGGAEGSELPAESGETDSNSDSDDQEVDDGGS